VLHNKVRGLSPYPAAYTLLKLKDKEEPISVKIFASSITTENNLKVGEYTSDNKSLIQVGTSTHNVSISEVQFPGKKRLNIKQFLAGFEVNSIEKFT
jgi:methionyl-tRNA formyltransferase